MKNADKYSKRSIKAILNDGTIGRLISIQHNENVGHWHQAHSFVRGNWNNSDVSCPMILAKCCHDMDILQWLVNSECKRVSSFGSLSHFKADEAPQGASKRCLDGCPVSASCPYYAPDLYLTDNLGWPTSAISADTSYLARFKALQTGPYGRCVYHCDNNVVDHQVVNMEFANEVTVAFTMCAFTKDISRTIKLMGTKGEIRGTMEKNEIEILHFGTGKVERISYEKTDGLAGHGGGDEGLMRDFIKLIQTGGKAENKTSAEQSVQSHMIAFAAEQARLEHRVVELADFMNDIRHYSGI